MNLTNLRSIHMPERGGIGRAATDLDASDASTQEPSTLDGPLQRAQPSTTFRLRKVMRTPIEEFQARVAQHGAMEAFPDALAAILLYEHKTPTLNQKSEISIHINGDEYKFYHPDSLTCHPSNAGKQVRVSFDRDDLSCVFVLSEDGRYLETIPRKGKHAWFGKDVSAEIAQYRRLTNHVAAHLDRIHAPDNKAEHDRAQTNAEKIQYLNEFLPQNPQPSTLNPQRFENPSTLNPQPSTPLADALLAASKTARRQQSLHREAVEEEEDLAELARKARMGDYRAPQAPDTLMEEQQQ